MSNHDNAMKKYSKIENSHGLACYSRVILICYVCLSLSPQQHVYRSMNKRRT